MVKGKFKDWVGFQKYMLSFGGLLASLRLSPLFCLIGFAAFSWPGVLLAPVALHISFMLFYPMTWFIESSGPIFPRTFVGLKLTAGKNRYPPLRDDSDD